MCFSSQNYLLNTTVPLSTQTCNTCVIYQGYVWGFFILYHWSFVYPQYHNVLSYTVYSYAFALQINFAINLSSFSKIFVGSLIWNNMDSIHQSEDNWLLCYTESYWWTCILLSIMSSSMFSKKFYTFST